jgi:hypothetical protein
MSSSGGDGGYGARQDADERRKAEARARINALFGVSSPMPSAAGENAEGKFGALLGEANAAAPTVGIDQEEVARNRTGLDELYSKVRNDAYGGMRRQLDEQKSDAGRNLKFELFARGLRGGSADIDQNARLGRAYTDGRAQLGARADGLVSNLRSNDEQTRLGLLQGIDSGMDQGSALSSALAQMRNNSDRAYSEAQGGIIGDVLGAGGQFYANNQMARGQQRARQWWQGQQSPFTAGQSVGPMVTPDSGRR